MPSRETIFTGLCWILAAYFAYASLYPFLNPPSVMESGRYVFLLLAVFFFVVPVAQKVEIFQFLTFESRLAKLDDRQKQHDAEIKHLQTIQATLTNSLSSVNTNTNSINHTTNFYGRDAAMEWAESTVPISQPHKPTLPASAHVDAKAFGNSVPDNANGDPSEVTLQLTPQQELLFLNTDLHIALRVSVGKNLSIYKSKKEAKYLTSRQLWQMFIRHYPHKEGLHQSFEYFFQVANAAAHGQRIPDSDLISAVVVGRALLEEVRQIPTVSDGSPEPNGDE
ncbi:hypothetical protein ACVMIX_001905 [Rhizobium leguminosarum]